ncbi:hypothetical protein FHX09_003157 [Rhizobium sp. BK538]|nr:hypothetical protein [Rhizobium sp. BK538]
MSALAGGQNIDRTAERLQNLQDFSNLSCGLAGFEIDNEPQPDSSDAGKLVLPQVLLLACASDQGADIGWASDLFCHHCFPDRESNSISDPLSRIIFPIGKITNAGRYLRK